MRVICTGFKRKSNREDVCKVILIVTTKIVSEPIIIERAQQVLEDICKQEKFSVEWTKYALRAQ